MHGEYIHCLSSYYSSMEHSAVAKGAISPYTSKAGHHLYPLLESRHWGLSWTLTRVSLTRFCSSSCLVVILDSYSHLSFYRLIPRVTGSGSWDLDFYFLQDDGHIKPLLRQRWHHGCQGKSWAAPCLGASLPQSSSWVSLEISGNCWKKPFFLHLFAAGLWFSACVLIWGTVGLHITCFISTTDVTASRDRETFSNIFFLGKTVETKYCLLEIKKCCISKQSFAVMKGWCGLPVKLYSHFWSTVKGSSDIRTTSLYLAPSLDIRSVDGQSSVQVRTGPLPGVSMDPRVAFLRQE